MNPSMLNGKKVIAANGYILGEVDGVDVDLNTWKASTLYVSLSDEAVAGFGLRKPLMSRITACLPTRIVRSVGDVITVNEPISDLEDAAKECYGNPTNLKGKKVTVANGYVVGEVEELDLASDSWQVTNLQVSLTKSAAVELGLDKPFLRKVEITIPTKVVDSVGNMIILKENIQDLKALAKCLECG